MIFNLKKPKDSISQLNFFFLCKWYLFFRSNNEDHSIVNINVFILINLYIFILYVITIFIYFYLFLIFIYI